MDLAAVIVVPGALDEAMLLEAIDQADGAVMTDEQLFGNLADGRAVIAFPRANGQQHLMLLGFEAFFAGGGFAELEEAADQETKARERAVIVAIQIGLRHINIVSRYYLVVEFHIGGFFLWIRSLSS
jgi:hypothetical protein